MERFDMSHREMVNESPVVCCLCPTYRRPQLLENALACFLAQTYPADKRFLLILDDAGQITPQETASWKIVSTPTRYPSLPAKYNALAALATTWKKPDIFVIWEDDDIYLPWHIQVSVQASKATQWAKPSRIWSLFRRVLHSEPGAGRFHASLTVHRALLEAVGGWPETRQANFDQQFLHRLTQAGLPGDPCDSAPPSYVFRWETTKAYHGQSFMRSPEDVQWYDTVANVAAPAVPVQTVVPRFDLETSNLLIAFGHYDLSI